MKNLTTTVCAAMFGAILGSLMTAVSTRVQAAGVDKVEAREFILLDENNRTAGRLGTVSGKSV